VRIWISLCVLSLSIQSQEINHLDLDLIISRSIFFRTNNTSYYGYTLPDNTYLWQCVGIYNAYFRGGENAIVTNLITENLNLNNSLEYTSNELILEVSLCQEARIQEKKNSLRNIFLVSSIVAVISFIGGGALGISISR